jgi:hypothetical protein
MASGSGAGTLPRFVSFINSITKFKTAASSYLASVLPMLRPANPSPQVTQSQSNPLTLAMAEGGGIFGGLRFKLVGFQKDDEDRVCTQSTPAPLLAMLILSSFELVPSSNARSRPGFRFRPEFYCSIPSRIPSRVLLFDPVPSSSVRPLPIPSWQVRSVLALPRSEGHGELGFGIRTEAGCAVQRTYKALGECGSGVQGWSLQFMAA